MQLIDILSKPVISLYNGTNEGVVLSACFSEDLKKLNYLIIVSSTDSEADDELILSARDVFKFGSDAIMIKNNSCLQLKTNLDAICFNNPINSTAYDMDGKLLGKVSDVIIDEQLAVEKLVIAGKTLERAKLISHSLDTLIFKSVNAKVSLSKFKPSATFISNVDNPVKIMQMGVEQKQDYANDRTQISRLTLNANLLLGRKITKNILSGNGELVAKSGATISSKIITMARTHQKLRELAIYSE